MRGFDVGSQSLRFNDVGGLIYARRTPIEAAERVDVFLGPNALLDNDAPVGGSINLAPKRAGDVPLTRVIASYVSDSDVGLQVDTGRRFGPGGAFGVRVNLAGQIGDTPIDNQDELYQLGALALDYRSDRLKRCASVLEAAPLAPPPAAPHMRTICKALTSR